MTQTDPRIREALGDECERLREELRVYKLKVQNVCTLVRPLLRKGSFVRNRVDELLVSVPGASVDRTDEPPA